MCNCLFDSLLSFIFLQILWSPNDGYICVVLLPCKFQAQRVYKERERERESLYVSELWFSEAVSFVSVCIIRTDKSWTNSVL